MLNTDELAVLCWHCGVTPDRSDLRTAAQGGIRDIMQWKDTEAAFPTTSIGTHLAIASN